MFTLPSLKFWYWDFFFFRLWFLDKRVERSVWKESETTPNPTANGSYQEYETKEKNGPNKSNNDRGTVVVSCDRVSTRNTWSPQRNIGKVFLSNMLQFIWRVDGHVGFAERVVKFRILLLHEQTVQSGFWTTVQSPTQYYFEA